MRNLAKYKTLALDAKCNKHNAYIIKKHDMVWPIIQNAATLHFYIPI